MLTVCYPAASDYTNAYNIIFHFGEVPFFLCADVGCIYNDTSSARILQVFFYLFFIIRPHKCCTPGCFVI